VALPCGAAGPLGFGCGVDCGGRAYLALGSHDAHFVVVVAGLASTVVRQQRRGLCVDQLDVAVRASRRATSGALRRRRRRPVVAVAQHDAVIVRHPAATAGGGKTL
jgi:hypothetical protein